MALYAELEFQDTVEYVLLMFFLYSYDIDVNNSLYSYDIDVNNGLDSCDIDVNNHLFIGDTNQWLIRIQNGLSALARL